MARKLRLGWLASTHRNAQQSLKSSRTRQKCQRRPLFELLEARHLLSATGLSSHGALESVDALEQVRASDVSVPHGIWASLEEYEANNPGGFAEFTAFEPWPDFDPNEDGFQITYSYSNFLDGALPGGLTAEELIAGTEEAFALWASVAPLNFIEVDDSGPDPTDPVEGEYAAFGNPQIRIGYHSFDGSGALAHAYFPSTTGLGGDVHFATNFTWDLISGDGDFDVIEVMVHELGHSLGLGHEEILDAIMNPIIGNRYSGLGTGFLFDDDIAGIQSLYGAGEGSVTPLTLLVVDTLVDEADGDVEDGDISLRDAIAFATIGDGNGIRRISFAEELAGGTIVLDPSLGSLVIDGRVTIEGLGSDLITVQATDPTPGVANGDGFQIFTISNNPDPESEDPDTVANVEISGLTLTGGDSATAGGAIYNTEALVLTDVKLTGNATMERGGAIYSTYLVTLLQSTVEGNSAGDDGGGIFTTGGVHLTESTVSGNSSGDEGGGIAVEGIGVNSGQEILITSSTISGNTAIGNGGGLHVLDENPTRLVVLHSTVFENTSGGTGGGIYQYDGVLVLDHAIIAKNIDSGLAPDLDNVNFFADPAILAKYSFIGNSTGSVINQVEPNQIGNSQTPLDPQLGPLADNGGPTLTHKPIPTSPVLDSGDPNIPFPVEFDQRGEGFARIIGGFIDIGALETTGFANTILVDTLVDESDGNFAAGDLSLREAIERSNSEGGEDRIRFAPSLAGGTIVLNSALGEILITDSMTIDAGDLSIGITIDASSADPTPNSNNGDGIRIFRIDNSDPATRLNVGFVGLSLIGGDVTGDGGAIHSLENLTLDTVSILGNAATGDGGGVYQRDSKLNISQSTLANNYAGDDGGGLFSNTNLPNPILDPDPNPIVGNVTNTTFSGNEAGDEGGAVYNFDGQLTLAHTTIINNQADWGDGVVSFGDTATETRVYSSIIVANPFLPSDPGFDPVTRPNRDVNRSRGLAFNSFVSEGYNFIGIGNAFLNFNQTGDIAEMDDPMLGPLANNGGGTLTHAPLIGSPVIDAGDPALADSEGSEPLFDQRGTPFSRFGDGNRDATEVIDIGAIEIQTPDPETDFDQDGNTDGADFLAWQRGVGKTTPTLSDGDANGDGSVDGDDLDAWGTNFGVETPSGLTSPTAIPTAIPTAVTQETYDYDTIDGLPPVVHHTRPVTRTPYRSEVAADDFSVAARHELFTRAGRSQDSLRRSLNDDLLVEEFVRGARPVEVSISRHPDNSADIRGKQVAEEDDVLFATESLDAAFADLLTVGLARDE